MLTVPDTTGALQSNLPPTSGNTMTILLGLAAFSLIGVLIAAFAARVLRRILMLMPRTGHRARQTTPPEGPAATDTVRTARDAPDNQRPPPRVSLGSTREETR